MKQNNKNAGLLWPSVTLFFTRCVEPNQDVAVAREPDQPTTEEAGTRRRDCCLVTKALAAGLFLGLALGATPGHAADEREYPFDPALFKALQWRNVGPFRGGRVTTVTGVPGQPHLYYFGGTGGGVWRTENAGASWENISDEFFKTGSVGAIAVALSDPNVIYAGMGESPIRGVASSHGDGVYKSTNAGKTWVHMGLDRTRQISAVRIHPDNPDVVYVAAQGSPWQPSEERGIYRSVDGGATWEQLLFIDQRSGASDLAMDPTNPRILYAAFWDHQRTPWQIRSGGAGSGIHKSSDGGNTWEKLENGLPTEMGKIGVAVSPARPDRVWAMVEATDHEGGVYRSDDGGQSWRRINSDRALRARAWYYTHIFADPQDEETVYVLAAPMMKSTDGGKNFSYIRTPHMDNHGLWINPDNNRWMINSNDGGANISFDGGATWSTQGNQPTAQFYRVIADNRFPYYLYAGQQDNTTVAIASRSLADGIGRPDWHPVGGGEAAHVAFDPDNPSLVYATEIMGLITEYDRRTGLARNISVYPELVLGIDAKDYKYRFNWNAPVIVSQHDPKVIYHAGNVLFRSTDRGQSWSVVSPDLTRNEPEKQGRGGVPYTNEAAGAEIYNTIFYVAESPHDAGIIWVGTDDGLVHLTRDGGETWTNVTPRGIGEAQINAIEISRHDPSTAYVAVTRYKFGDFTPLIYRTENFGARWSLIVDGIPDESFTRVVREDPQRPGLLYAGTETGVYVSFDGGNKWQPLQLNLPATPVTDLKAHRGDIIISTQGRAFWILDDPAPLRELHDEIAASTVHLYRPGTALRLGEAQGSPPLPGTNPPNGAVIYYYLAEKLDTEETPVTIEILDSAGQVLRRMGTEEDPQVECAKQNDKANIFLPPDEEKFTADRGMNRVVWDLRRANLECVPDQLFVFGWMGPRSAPGRYTVRLTVGDVSMEQPLELRGDPRLDLQPADFTESARLLDQLYHTTNEAHRAIVTMQAVRRQAQSLVDLTQHHANAADIKAAATKLAEDITDWEDTVIQSRHETPQDVANYPGRLNAHLVQLMRDIDSNDPPVTTGARDRFGDLMQSWAASKAEMERLLDSDLASFNQLLRASGVPAVYAPPSLIQY